MNSKERVLSVLERKPTGRTPVDLWHTPEIGAALRERFGVEDDLDLYWAMGLDKIVWVFPDYVGGAGAQVGAAATGKRTMWGVPLKDVRVGQALYQEFAGAPMAEYDNSKQLDRYPFWPDPARFDYDAAVTRAQQASREFAVIGPWVSLFEIYCQLRGLEQAVLDLALRPDFLEAALDRIEAIQAEMMREFFRRAGDSLDMVFVSDDIAGQTGLLFSPEIWRRHLEPRLARWCGLIHEHGLKVFYHTDGAAEPLIGSLIDCGIDVLNPIQHACPGMDPAELKRKYGHHVIFHGGVDNQQVLPFGTPDDVRREVANLLATLGAGGGFICCSCHNVQAGTPIENILAMVEAVRESR